MTTTYLHFNLYILVVCHSIPYASCARFYNFTVEVLLQLWEPVRVLVNCGGEMGGWEVTGCDIGCESGEQMKWTSLALTIWLSTQVWDTGVQDGLLYDSLAASWRIFAFTGRKFILFSWFLNKLQVEPTFIENFQKSLFSCPVKPFTVRMRNCEKVISNTAIQGNEIEVNPIYNATSVEIS